MPSTPSSPSPAAGPGESLDDRVLGVIQEVLGLDTPPPREASLLEDLDLGSMDTMTLVLTLENEFDEHIDEEIIETLVTVGDVVDLVRAQVEAAG